VFKKTAYPGLYTISYHHVGLAIAFEIADRSQLSLSETPKKEERHADKQPGTHEIHLLWIKRPYSNAGR
jgi:hypothetical protein